MISGKTDKSNISTQKKKQTNKQTNKIKQTNKQTKAKDIICSRKKTVYKIKKLMKQKHLISNQKKKKKKKKDINKTIHTTQTYT